MKTLTDFVRGQFGVDCSAELEQLRAGGVELTERDIRVLCQFAQILPRESGLTEPLFEHLRLVFVEPESSVVVQLVDLAEKLAGGLLAAFESDRFAADHLGPVTGPTTLQ